VGGWQQAEAGSPCDVRGVQGSKAQLASCWMMACEVSLAISTCFVFDLLLGMVGEMLRVECEVIHEHSLTPGVTIHAITCPILQCEAEQMAGCACV
jgi:hypothetical protein